MISISPGHGAKYLTAQVAAGRENYYTGAVAAGEPPGVWRGRGAEALGLTGLVDGQDMTALYEHRLDPRDERFREPAEWGAASTLGGPPRKYQSAEEAYERMLAAEPEASGERREELRLNAERSARSNVQFLDATFSAPKSVTVLAVAFERQAVEAERAGDAATAAAWTAHRDAVEAAVLAGNAAMLDYLQDVAGYSRVGHHGGNAGRYVDAHDWVVASFLQHDSRDQDPQLHVHNAILNRVECADGEWRTLHGRALYAYRAAAGALAERVMEEHLIRALGVQFATRPDGKAREVRGVRPEVMDLFSSRRRQITPKVAQLVADFEDRFGRTPNALELSRLSQRATLATRRPKSHDGESAEQRLDRWDAELRAELADGLAGVARDVLGWVDEPQEAPSWSPAAVIETAVADVQAAKPTWPRADLFAAIGRALPDGLGGLEPTVVRELLDGLTEHALSELSVEQVAGERDAGLPMVAELRLADGRSAYEEPAGRRYALTAQLSSEHVLRRAAVERGAPALEAADAGAAADRLVEAGLTLGPDQRQALTGVLTSGAKVETLIGPAGTGKSTVVGGLARAWTETGRGVVGLATSQVATEVLVGEGLAAQNVTRWLAVQERLSAGEQRPEDSDWQLSTGDLVVVDEAAMLPTADLVAIHQRAAAAGAKLLLTGDHRQLAAVGAGGGMALLAKAGGHELTEVRRFSAGWEGAASLRLRDGDDSVLHDYRRHGRLIDGGTPEQARSSAARAWLADTLDGKQSVLVVGSNEDAARLSAEVRSELVRLGRVEENGVELGRDGTTAGIGDLVQARRNGWDLVGVGGNERAPINRETYRVTATSVNGGLVVEHVDGPYAGSKLTLPSAYVATDVTLGYAGTVHSTQGRTVDTSHVIVGAGTSPEALYVGLSRGRHGNHAHVVTHATDEAQPVGVGQDIARVDPLAVLAGVVRADAEVRDTATAAAVAQAEADRTRRASVQTAVERFAAEAEMVYGARTTACLDRLTADGALTADQRIAFAGDPSAMGSLSRLLRTAELAGHDPDRVLTLAMANRDFTGARSLPQVVYSRIERQLAGRLTPTATSYADMVPTVGSATWREQLTARATAADARRKELGVRTAAQSPQWAVEALGSAPAGSAARLDWERRAGAVAAYRELTGHTDAADALGPAALPGQPEHYAAWRAAWTALGRPEATRADAELSNGQLRVRVRALAREEAWAPAYVGESLTATSLSAQARRRDAVLTSARAEAADDPADAARLREQAVDAAAIADALDLRIAQLEQADDARAQWLAHTAVTRDAAERARAELAARGVSLEADDTVTAEEWLAAHRADLAEADQRRPVTDDDLVDSADDRADHVTASTLETAVPDIRDTPAEHVADERDRIPEAAESEAAVRRAQAALAEIEQRRQLDDRRAAEEQRADQLNRWRADDGMAAEVDAAGHVDSR